MAENIIKNPARNTDLSDTAEHEKYVPQYRILGVSPELVNFANREEPLSDDSVIVESPENDLNHKEKENNFSIPNIGNNMDHAWTEDSAAGVTRDPISLKNSDKYILLAKEEILLIGSLASVEDMVRKIFYKEHHIEKYNQISVDDLVVLKKMKIKIGIFVE